MKALLRWRPDLTTTDYTASHLGRGLDYDANFANLPMRTFLTGVEGQAIQQLLADVKAAEIVDLACGTGRITRILTTEFGGSRICGVDVSKSMLSEAANSVPGARFTVGDIRNLSEIVPDQSVDLLTSFRFFPNAEPQLRTAAYNAISRAVRGGGHVLINNHRNFWSPSYLLRRARSTSAPGARNRDILRPLELRGFRVVGRRSLGVVPHNDIAPYLLSQRTAEQIENFNRTYLARWHSFGTNTVWLLRKHS